MLEDAESSTLFAWRIVLVFESNIPSKSQFSRWRKAHFFPNRPFYWLEEKYVLLYRKPSMQETAASSTLFPVRIELVLEGICHASHSFQWGEWLILLQVGLFTQVEEIHVSLEWTPSVFKGGVSSTLFSCENWVSFWKEYFLQIITFKVEKGSFCSK
jgi:hypothetical protein